MSNFSYSYSTITDFLKCQKYFELRNILKVAPENPDLLALRFGSALHLGIQDLFEGGDGVGVFSIFWKNETYHTFPKLSWNDHQALGEIFLSKFERLHKKNFEPVMFEERLTITLGNLPQVTVAGTPDWIGMYKGVPSIVDWKTAAWPYDQLKLTVSDQLHLYAHMVKEKGIMDAKQIAYVAFIKNVRDPRIQIITKEITQEGIDSAVSNLYNICKEIENKKEFTRNHNNCLAYNRPCDYFERCHGAGLENGKKVKD